MPSSLTTLLSSTFGFSPYPPVSVFGTGANKSIVAFLGSSSLCFPTFFSVLLCLPLLGAFSLSTGLALLPVFPFPAHTLFLRPHSSVSLRCRNLHLLSIDYASQPRLRSRLSQSRSALLWNPWIFGLKDSHLHLATHSGILSS